MPPRTHSILAPSAKEWMHCGLAAKFLATKEEDEGSEAAQFGTEAHALAEVYINESLKLTAYGAKCRAHSGRIEENPHTVQR